MKLSEKPEYLLEVKRKYTYRIFTNGNGDVSIELQLTDDFKKAILENFALVTTTKENYERVITVDYLNNLFLDMKKIISKYGTFGEIKCNYHPVWGV